MGAFVVGLGLGLGVGFSSSVHVDASETNYSLKLIC